ncbi:alpha-ketoglutarate-dependent dioxygenase FTO isoform X2 [Silurus asotus]|uniref:Alpha-ketoglutarate-dependent dioxygenase FTO n=1 Tax=Silurus asotus TaxID=30991 RepID=A0AAD5B2Z3_SILAS|nr:alpha-ketoglutarate-dependent dioxygenase FTO isoform X2 [Silurus asotus]
MERGREREKVRRQYYWAFGHPFVRTQPEVKSMEACVIGLIDVGGHSSEVRGIELDFHKGLLTGEDPRAVAAPPTRPVAPPPLLPPTREKEREREKDGATTNVRDQWAEREREMERRERTRSEREWDRDKVRDFNRDEREAARRSRSRDRDRRRKERGKSKEKKSEKKGAGLNPEEQLQEILSDVLDSAQDHHLHNTDCFHQHGVHQRQCRDSTNLCQGAVKLFWRLMFNYRKNADFNRIAEVDANYKSRADAVANSRQCKQCSRNMKRSDDSEREKRRKRRRLLQELGEQKIPFLSPSDPGFQKLWDTSYSGLMLRCAGSLSPGLDERVQSALITLRDRGCLLRDLVRVRERDVFTAVSRALVGQPGCTYRYLDTRLFTIPWHCEDDEGLGRNEGLGDKPCCDARLRAACKALWELNQFFCSDVQQHQNARASKRKRSEEEEGKEETKHEGCSEDRTCEEKEDKKAGEDSDSGQGCSRSSPHSSKSGPIRFNITLINYMDPAGMSQLKEEPYYGMGKMAVGWHHDENLVPLSPVAVYSYSCPGESKTEVKPEKKEGQTSNEGEKGDGEGGSQEGAEEAGEEGTSQKEAEGKKEKVCWRVGLKVAWDIHTPGLALPLQSGDCYYMTDDLNRTHQHCVLAGDAARFSSTHRVAQCTTGTLEYIQKRCSEALENLHTDPETGTKSLRSLLLSTLQHIEDIHNEVEFEWLRQYWFQGRRYARFCSWWSKPMERLETDWKQMERMKDSEQCARRSQKKGPKEPGSESETERFCVVSVIETEKRNAVMSLFNGVETKTELLLTVVEDESNVQENRQEMAETLLNALSDRQQHRQTWRDRCQSSLAQTLPPEEAPVDRPYWSSDDPDMPLPFDLSDIISRVESLLWRQIKYFSRAQTGRWFIFRQDNDSKHTAKITMSCWGMINVIYWHQTTASSMIPTSPLAVGVKLFGPDFGSAEVSDERCSFPMTNTGCRGMTREIAGKQETVQTAGGVWTCASHAGLLDSVLDSVLSALVDVMGKTE